MKYADLHIHTTFSDGTFTPEQVVQEAGKKGLSCIAITDHDSVAGIERAIKEAERLKIELIPGVELTAEINGEELHILGYFIDWQAEWFREKLRAMCDIRRKRAEAIIEKLHQHGIDLKEDEIFYQARPQAIGRLHIARMLLDQGFVDSTSEAFRKYIGNDGPCYVKKFKLTPAEAIEMIHQLKGLAVLAHPYSIGDDELIPELVQAGLEGLEAYYPEHNRDLAEHYQKVAGKYGLLLTGGSDCHGLGKDSILLGEVKVPYDLVQALKDRLYGQAKS